ncbi:MAG: HYR domain-containing protein [Saprospiraceae bacterium]
MKFPLLLTYFFILCSLFLTQKQLSAQQNCDYEFSLKCPAKYQGCIDESSGSANTGFPSITRSGILCDSVQFTYDDQILGQNQCNLLFDRLWSATIPGSNLTRKCSQRVELFDNTLPLINSCPVDVTIALPDSTYNWANPQVTDNCGTVTLSSSHTNGSSFPLGTTTVVFTATDGCGNTNSCSFSITVDQGCTTEFTLECPDDYTGCVGDDFDPSVIGSGNTTHMGDFCGTKSISYTDNTLTNTECSVVIERTWAATASETGETKTCVQRIELIDTEAPIVHTCPSDINVDVPNTTVTWTLPTFSDNCGTVNTATNYNSGSTFPIGVTEVIYTATDQCGNTSTCAFNVTVTDTCNTEFTIVCPPDFTGCRHINTDPSSTGDANVSHAGNFCGTLSISYVDTTITNTSCELVIERTWSATSSETGESKTCNQILVLVDDTPPSIVNCPPDVNLDTPNTALNWLDPQASDNCGQIQLTSNFNSGTVFPEGQTEVIYTATDQCGNMSTCSFFVNVMVDTCDQNFSIICPSNYYGCLGDNTDPFDTGNANVSHSGNFCGTLSISYVDSVLFNSTSRQVIQRVWYAIDAQDGTKKGCAQTITLEDNQGPSIGNCPADITLNTSDHTYTWSLPTASDNCSTVTIESDVANGSTFPIGSTTVTYTASDDSGNTSTCSFIVTVQEDCNQNFSINCPSNYEGCRGDSTDPSDIGTATVSHSGNFCGTVSVVFSDRIITSTDCSLIIEREWTAIAEKDGVKKRCVQMLRFEDKEAPSIHNCPRDVTLDFNNAQYTWTLPTASDNCSTVTLESSFPNGSTFPVGLTTVVYEASDDCGNSTRCSFNITVKSDNTGNGLVIICPEDIILDCGQDIHYNTWPQPEVTSTCSSCDEDYSSGFVDMGSIDGHKYYCSKFPATWQDAAEHARRMGGYLVIINDEYENKLLSEFLEVRSAFIGLSDHINEGHFKWIDGSSVSYSNWYPGQPNDYRGKQDYVELLDDGHWNDQYNYKKLEFIVELPCIKIEQISGPSSPQHFSGSQATIAYRVTDGCGNSETCSFKVIKSGSLNIHCPDDLTINLQSGHSSTYVIWDDPQVETCCTSSNTGASEIAGYVYMGSRDGHYYYCSKKDLTWHDAQFECEKHGGYLAVIDDEAENNMLANFLTVQSAYIGLSDHKNEGHFSWANGSALSYSNWYPGQPNNYSNDQHYVEMLNNGQWNDQYSYKKREYIMEIPGGVEITQLSGPVNGSSLSAGSYEVKYKAKDACGNVQVCSFNVKVEASDDNDLCNTGPTDSYGQWIESAQIGDFKNVSGNDGGYGDYSNICAFVTKGKVIDINLSAGTRSYGSSLYWAIFIDWNKDGYYSKSERIARGRSKIALKGRFIFSPSLPTGNFAMRITLNTYGYQENGCETVTHGEVEDYCLTVNEDSYATSKPETKSIVQMPTVEMEPYDLLDEKIKPIPLNGKNEFGSVRVFPNPFFNTIEIKGTDFEGLHLWSIHGKLIKNITFSVPTSQINIDLNDLDSGAYLIEISRTDGTTEVKKIIKR